MNGGGIGIAGLYLGPTEVAVLLIFAVTGGIWFLAWATQKVGWSISKRPQIHIHKPSEYFWQRYDELQSRVMWHIKGGGFEDDRSMLNWVLQELHFMNKFRDGGNDEHK